MLRLALSASMLAAAATAAAVEALQIRQDPSSPVVVLPTPTPLPPAPFPQAVCPDADYMSWYQSLPDIAYFCNYYMALNPEIRYELVEIPGVTTAVPVPVTTIGGTISLTSTTTEIDTAITTIIQNTRLPPVVTTTTTTVSSVTTLACAANTLALSQSIPMITATPNIQVVSRKIVASITQAANKPGAPGKNNVAASLSLPSGVTVRGRLNTPAPPYPSRAASLGCSCLGLSASSTITTTITYTDPNDISYTTVPVVVSPIITVTTTETTTTTVPVTSTSTLPALTLPVTQTMIQPVPTMQPGYFQYAVYPNVLNWDLYSAFLVPPLSFGNNTAFAAAGYGADPATAVAQYYDICLRSPPPGISTCNSLTYVVQGFLRVTQGTGIYTFSINSTTVSRYGSAIINDGAYVSLYPVSTITLSRGPLSLPQVLYSPPSYVTLTNNTLIPIAFVASTSDGRAILPISVTGPNGITFNDLSSFAITPCQGVFTP